MYTQYISTSAKYLSLMYFTINLRNEIRHDLVSNLIVITILKCLWPKQTLKRSYPFLQQMTLAGPDRIVLLCSPVGG